MAENPRINITNHAYERYVERIVGITDPVERRQYIVANKNILTEHIEKLWTYAEYIWQGQLYDNTTKKYWLRDNIVIVTDTQVQTLITLYRIDYGYKDELNRYIAETIMREITEQKKRLEEIEAESSEKIDRMNLELDSLQMQIKAHEDIIAALRQQLNALTEDIKAERAAGDILRKELEINLHRICNGLEYKKEIQASKKGA